MGLIIKTKDNGEVKRRLVLDTRRSGGNAKSRLPERLVLPRPLDVVKLLKHMHRDPREENCGTEFALVDVADAFTTLPVAPAEWKHTMAPSLQEDEVLIFQALLFGYKVAPLLYSRLAAMLARMLQSSMEDTEPPERRSIQTRCPCPVNQGSLTCWWHRYQKVVKDRYKPILVGTVPCTFQVLYIPFLRLTWPMKIPIFPGKYR